MEDISPILNLLPVESPMPDNMMLETPSSSNSDLALFIDRSPMPNKDGFTNIESERVHILVDALKSVGIPVTENAPSADDITAGIETARTLIIDEKSTEFLENLPYKLVKSEDMDDERATRLKIEGQPLWIDPSAIVGTGTFDETTGWSGRGDGHGKQYINSLGISGVGKSIDVIEDYAARDTQLPKLEYGALGIILYADASVLAFTAHSSHRVSAAKLRGEALSFDTLMVYDRTKKPD